MEDAIEDMRAKVSRKWQRRFEAFDQAEGAFEVRQTPAYKQLGFWEKRSITFNIWAMIFGIFYYFVLGIPKRGLGIAGVSFIIVLVLIYNDAPPSWLRAHSIGTQVVFATMANYYYYIKVVKGRDSWDPLRDVRSA